MTAIVENFDVARIADTGSGPIDARRDLPYESIVNMHTMPRVNASMCGTTSDEGC